MTADPHIQDWADLRRSTDPPSHVGWFLTAKWSILSTWPFHIVKCIIIMCNEKLSFLNVLRETSIGAEFGQFLLFWKFCEFLLVFTQQVFLYFGISLRNKVSRRKLCRKKPLNPNSQSRRVSLHLVSLWLILHTNPLLLRRHQADWRK